MYFPRILKDPAINLTDYIMTLVNSLLIFMCRSEPMDSVKSGLWLPSHSPESIWVCRECQ